MAYFSDDNLQDRVHILYFMRAMGVPLTRVQLASAFSDNQWIGYFEISLLLDDMERAGAIASVHCAFGKGYAMTSSGEDSLELFFDQLPLSIRTACDEYAKTHGESLLNMEQFFARAISSPSGGYDVVLRAFEHDRLLLSLVINLPDIQVAKTACDNWEKLSADAYKALLQTLLPEERK